VKTDLSIYDNSWYRPGGNTVTRIIWYFVNHIFFTNGLFPFSGFKIRLLRLFGAKIGRGVNIKPRVHVKYPWKLKIGEFTWIGEDVWIDNLVKVDIGSNVCLSQGAMLLTGNHNYKKTTFDLMVGEIVLHDGVWIGAKAVVCPGVTCHEHSVLSVGSIANSDLEARGIYQGNPAQKVKERVIG
jgi:putative colanic acid biosynthesis acetyltransferase WcaF